MLEVAAIVIVGCKVARLILELRRVSSCCGKVEGARGMLCWTLPKVCLHVLLDAAGQVLARAAHKMPGLEEGALAANTKH